MSHNSLLYINRCRKRWLIEGYSRRILRVTEDYCCYQPEQYIFTISYTEKLSNRYWKVFEAKTSPKCQLKFTRNSKSRRWFFWNNLIEKIYLRPLYQLKKTQFQWFLLYSPSVVFLFCLIMSFSLFYTEFNSYQSSLWPENNLLQHNNGSRPEEFWFWRPFSHN